MNLLQLVFFERWNLILSPCKHTILVQSNSQMGSQDGKIEPSGGHTARLAPLLNTQHS